VTGAPPGDSDVPLAGDRRSCMNFGTAACTQRVRCQHRHFGGQRRAGLERRQDMDRAMQGSTLSTGEWLPIARLSARQAASTVGHTTCNFDSLVELAAG
jgi:hypothetical protein